MGYGQILFGEFFPQRGGGIPNSAKLLGQKIARREKFHKTVFDTFPKLSSVIKSTLKCLKCTLISESVLNSDSNTNGESGPPSEIGSTAGALVFVVVSGA